jgi:hypothetical protein
VSMNTVVQLLKLDWKSATRSPVLHKNILINLFLGLTFLYLAVNFLVLGFLLDELLMNVEIPEVTYKLFPEDWVLRRLDRFLIYYFLIDFLVRYFMQKLPAMAIQPLLHLPIAKSKLINFMLLKTVLSPFNIFQFLILGPFMYEVTQNLDSTIAAWAWVGGLTMLIFTFNFFAIYLKRSADLDWRIYLAILASLITIAATTFFEIVDFLAISGMAFDALVDWPILVSIPALLLVFSYWVNFNYLRDNLYLSKISKRKSAEVTYAGTGFLSRFGLVGKLTELEFKFIWRNKRPRAVLLMTGLFLGYGLLIFTQEETPMKVYAYIMFAIIITGMFILNYGQYLLGWDGGHFDHVLTRRVSFEQYYLSKYLMFALVSTGCMLLSIPYVYFGLDVLLLIFCVFLFNVGVTAHVVMFFGSFNPKKIDMSQTSMLNWQGVGASQFLLILPSLGLPIAVFTVVNVFSSTNIALAVLAAIGFAGLVATKLWMKMLAAWLNSKRYEIASDFRNG